MANLRLESTAKIREVVECALACDKTFKSEVLDEISGISDNGLHQLWVKMQVPNLKLFLVCTTYWPPRTPTTSLDLSASLICASLLKEPIYLLGDINCNLLQPDLIDSHAFANFCYTYSWCQMVTKPTRMTDSTVLLDIILVSDAKQVTQVKVLSSSISDHDLVYVTWRQEKQRISTTFMTTRSFKNYSLERFNNDFIRAPWSVLETFDDPELYAF